MSNTKRVLAGEVRRLEAVVARRDGAVSKAEKALKDKRGLDPEGHLARKVERAQRARLRLAVAREREAAWQIH